MGKLMKILGKLLKITGISTIILFVVYFWNLDQKIMGWAYVQVNKIFDSKKTDIKF